jgi:hypothetical protein
VEAVYQLEEGEILVEPTPSRKDRRALLFYEAAEGGAGALSRLTEEKAAFRTVARKALEIMHYDPASIEDAAIKGPSALVSIADARCVAGCYRCLLSYFNQPDQENIDRRQEPALQLLLRRRRTITESICRREGSGVAAGDSRLAARRVLQVNGRREFDSFALRSLASPP